MKDLHDYLNQAIHNILKMPTLEIKIQLIYRDFYTFLGPHTPSWYADFIAYLKQTFAPEFALCLRYLRTVDFLEYRSQLKIHLP